MADLEEPDVKTPLTNSVQGVSEEPVDYDAIFGTTGKVQHREEFAKDTVIGECRNPKRVSWVEWLFMVVATLSMLGVIALSIDRLVFFEQQFVNLTIGDGTANETAPCNSWICTSDFIFAVALLVNLGFCAFYCYDGLFRERPFEILAYAAAVTVIIVYIVGNYAAKGAEDQTLRLVRLIFVVIFGPVNIVLALGSWWRMGYFVLNVIGTNKALVRAYRFRSFFQTLQLFNVEVLCNILVLAWYKDGEFLELWEKIIIFLLLVFSLIVTLIGGTAILWEIHILTFIWYALTFPCGLYYIYKLIEVAVNFDNNYRTEYTEYILMSGEYLTSDSVYVAAALIFACIFGLLVVVLLVVFMILSQRNFGEGLITKVHPPLHRYVSKLSMKQDS